MKHFQEYLSVKGKEEDDAITSVTGDTAKGPPIKPTPFATQGRGWKDFQAEPAKDIKPFIASNVRDKNYTSAKDGFANSGDENLVYEPKTIEKETKKEYVSFPGEVVSTVWKSDEFKNKTQNMSLPEFTAFIRSNLMIEGSKDIPTVHAFREGDIMPDPVEAMRYSAFLAKANPKLMEMLVSEVKKIGGLKSLVHEALRYAESREVLEGTDEEPVEKELEVVKLKKKKKSVPQA